MKTTFKDFLSEEPKTRHSSRTLDSLESMYSTFLDKIASPCSQMIDIYKKTLKKVAGEESFSYIWRGMKGKAITVYDRPIRTNRTPLEMPRLIHDTINEISEAEGFPAHRGNSIFTTTNYRIAGDWGYPYIVFPSNGFQYTWFTNQNQNYMFNYWMKFGRDVYNKMMKDDPHWDTFEDASSIPAFQEALHDRLLDEFKDLGPSKTNLHEVLKASLGQSNAIDILISGSSFYAIQIDGDYDLERFSKLFAKKFI